MSFFLEHTERIIQQYNGDVPLSVSLKAYYKQYPKLGSRDRRALSEAVFIYYRCRRFFKETAAITAVIAAGITLCNSTNTFLQQMITPEEPGDSSAMVEKVIPAFDELLSPELPAVRWLNSLWQQPFVFIRIRRRKEEHLAVLRQQEIPVEQVSLPGNTTGDLFRIMNGAAIDRFLPEEDYVVQDLSSQKSIYILMETLHAPPGSVWDVCSGAGGKSILLKDKLSAFSLLASDIRESILHNLQMRFRKYGLGKAEILVLNSTDENEMMAKLKGRTFDLVLCDVPCSGSGTWARTPEQFHFFEESNLQQFEALQYPIARNASRHVAAGGFFAYITCSVFRQENENVVQRLSEHTGMKLLHQQLIDGIDDKADCMFIAIFRKD